MCCSVFRFQLVVAAAAAAVALVGNMAWLGTWFRPSSCRWCCYCPAAGANVDVNAAAKAVAEAVIATMGVLLTRRGNSLGAIPT